MISKRDRNNQILAERQNGKTYSDIAQTFGLSLTRVYQIINKDLPKEAQRAGLSNRVFNILRRAGINTKEQFIAGATSRTGLELFGVAEKNLSELQEWSGIPLTMETFYVKRLFNNGRTKYRRIRKGEDIGT